MRGLVRVDVVRRALFRVYGFALVRSNYAFALVRRELLVVRRARFTIARALFVIGRLIVIVRLLRF